MKYHRIFILSLEMTIMFGSRIKQLLEGAQNNKTLRVVFSAALMVIMIVISIKLDINNAEVFLENHQKQAFFIGLMIYFIFSFTFLPTSPLTIFNAILLGPLEAVAISATGNLLSAVVGYFLGKTLVMSQNLENFKNSLPGWARKYDINSPIFIILGRMLPIGRIPLSYLCGAYRVPFFQYCWSSLVVYIIMASIISFASFGLGHLF